MTFRLCLPRDAGSVPVVRHVCRDALLKLGVAEDCVSDIELALTEACTNVLHHASGEDQYEVSVDVDADRCKIEVVDTGAGFDHASVGISTASHSAESGRGIFLMRALVDDLDFVSEPDQGTVVRFVKTLSLEPDSMLRVLSLDGKDGARNAALSANQP
ncbi:MAG: ATP-binding protein [Actinomycetota bacterium]